jgi:hypothetical protein
LYIYEITESREPKSNAVSLVKLSTHFSRPLSS